ncbi:MAG: hypothetical protein RLN87_05455 [Parasphingopyxis sp.]|uniref:hypothetical protein n=1 Tax=Parasphingopyxis sp. TaxID=1920299 RepID=UPI002623CD10|nr:hypothetical protein [uncultured Parasphingopyxis sp.]
MREVISILAIVIAFVYFVTFGSAVIMGLEREMHWALALGAFAAIILVRLWPLLPLAAWYGADTVWGWPWWIAIGLAVPVTIYILSHYWTRISDWFHRPARQQQGA